MSSLKNRLLLEILSKSYKQASYCGADSSLEWFSSNSFDSPSTDMDSCARGEVSSFCLLISLVSSQ